MEKVLYCFYKIINLFLKICAIRKCHYCTYILSSKHTYRPVRTRVVAQLFYSDQYQLLITINLYWQSITIVIRYIELCNSSDWQKAYSEFSKSAPVTS